ncbi:NAD(P)-binding domain-containing protein [Mycoplasmopsis caviae]|uniref:D-lactate dehydrogenase n=1 Tax=Mycoplasmopsis caviae TaxID=55603 RepID=A0A3P8K9L4_9BACT|nr:NAD(P)-dependent oxidoreductase [Mycoplasmopsis caviae]UUD35095.1 NAD(P)-binding domain-containing protein [Mycoplasmopsis caviae]VDR42089.1 D-lactate dehydrogenase [Mycoplasmopsis caviae]
MKIITFKVRDVEKPIFEEINKKFGHELEIHSESLTLENVKLTKSFDAVIVRVDGSINKELLDLLKANGVKYLLTRTVGTDHIDLDYAHKLGFKMARVPSYSPTAIAELAFAHALMLSRNTIHFAHKSLNNDFVVDAKGFATELKNKVVGIVGIGKIGLATAKMFKTMTNNVLGYDLYPSDEGKKVVKYTKTLEELVKKADIISFNCPYVKGKNDKMINDELIKLMKPGVIIVNTARGQIQDEEALLRGLQSGKIQAVATDVLNNEKEIFFKKHTKIENNTINQLLGFYPRFILTPHIGSYTDEAVKNMVEYTYENLKEYVETNECKNAI